ncbi:MAG: hypothetical protein JOZ62_11125, partial [Acidobacteriaceae bacterium]|nr:hypothetical protein [Acidobacteriaceae bacterium]
HSPAAGTLAARSAYLGGCAGTRNTEAGMRFGVPVSGTAAHSWTMAFGDEKRAFQALQALLGDSTVFLIDTYDTIRGAQVAAEVGRPAWGVRLDSGDIEVLSRRVREILDNSGLRDAKIMATNDLDEFRIAEVVGAGAPLDAFGVGTQLATSADAPALSAVYKLVELRIGDEHYYTAKFSEAKSTLPAPKQIYRERHCDLVALHDECSSDFKGEPLLRPVVSRGELVETLPRLSKSRNYAQSAISALPEPLLSIEKSAPYDVTVSRRLLQLAESIRNDQRFGHLVGVGRDN